MVALAALWLVAVSRVHVNASWSDEAWGYAAFPLFGEAPEIGDRVLFEPPGGPGLAGAVSQDRARRAGHGGHGRTGPDGPSSTACGWAGPRRMRATVGRSRTDRAGRDSAGALLPVRRSRRQPRQPLRRNRLRAARTNPGPRRSPCRTSPGSASTGRWSGRRMRMPESRPSCRIRRTDRPRGRWTMRHRGGPAEAGHDGPGLSDGRSVGGGAGARRARLREGPRRARRHLAGGGAGPAGADRGAPRRDGTLRRAGAAGSGGPRARAARPGGTGAGARHRAGEGGTQPPVRPRHHGRARHPNRRRRARSPPPAPG